MNKQPILIEKAMVLALDAHAGQIRKEAPTPYIVHPIRVAILLARYEFSDEVIAAGLVHDVVEDTAISADELREVLGDTVADLVVPITHNDSLSWMDKKRAYIETVRNASDAVKAISVTDKIANAESLFASYAREGSAIWKYFNAGKKKKIWFEKAMLVMLQESWKHPLITEYARMVEKMETLN